MLRAPNNRETKPRGIKDRPIRFATHLRNVVYDVMIDRGWTEVDREEVGAWDFLWADVAWMREVFDHTHLSDHQRINHFRNHYELTRKDHMVKNLKRLRKTLEREGSDVAKELDFYPKTYVVPGDYSLFAEEFRASGGVWIAKPVGRAQGRGIFLFNKLSQVSEWRRGSRYEQDSEPGPETYVFQQYISNPYTVGGKKFDMRLYAFVTSYSPLTVWFCRDGFGRFTFQRFTMDLSDLADNTVHLTNVAIQKHSDEYEGDGDGCKWSIQQLREYLTQLHGTQAVDQAFVDIQVLVVRSLQAVAGRMINDKHCFELYGYDVMLDSSLKPWLIEINASPSLTADTADDYSLKHAMLDDMFTIADLEGRLSGNETTVGGFDQIYGPDGWVKAGQTMLGAANRREENLKEILGKERK
ncbi:Tubulin-tyrosine ligase/Tubulin polyglutamylase [Carpediemonas membranifera]|uniref:Tubulin--tyrosine ligase-like protein 9 n=1 Tax=Carpediemonas membranifera TaxID=201153 RepID=A0A8J6E9Z3_9EUKA|nr:Tubulin-tyrosine ligase/Tubulin polyglutamylase [Carpediemonas membranifera]|eukprot:KAG9394015.1 Tubulin-tyrosine ligase/Tubulin polyglutamylase [Carpediemonas membranifera]